MSAPTRRLLLAAALAALTAAAPAQPGHPVVPPEPVPPAKLGARVWRPGHWQQNGGSPEWVAGSWARQPVGGARPEGHWLLSHGAWVWVAPR
jgi:hypothetical protein